MKTTITIIAIALTLAACTGDDASSDGEATTITTTTPDDESSSDDAASSSDDDSSDSSSDDASTDGSSDESSSSDGGSESTGAGVCEHVTYLNDAGMAFTCCCEGGAPEAACPDGLALCVCDDPSALPEHSACGSGCDGVCELGLSCRPNYAGGYLAECAAPCQADTDCGTPGDVCSAGWCVTPCGPAGECAEGTFCYPPQGEVDPAHPLPHCMPQVTR